jgi:anti-anti-sigma regulatory factor
MLRITTQDNRRTLVFRLEGRLEGPWVAELEKCWRGMEDDAGRPTLRVDLTGVTFVDAAGKAQLAAMHREGAQFVADDCLTKAIVAEIAGDGTGEMLLRGDES